MKSFIATLILLALTVIATAGNAVYINSTAGEMCTQAEALPQPQEAEFAAAMDGLESFWKKNLPWVSLTVGFNTVDRVTEQITLLKECAAHGDRYGYYNAMALLLDAIEDMRRLECFSVKNLL